LQKHIFLLNSNLVCSHTFRTSRSVREKILENITNFEKIIDAMKINDAKTASAIIMDHIKRFNDKMQKK